jgi:hypothetical protein
MHYAVSIWQLRYVQKHLLLRLADQIQLGPLTHTIFYMHILRIF